MLETQPKTNVIRGPESQRRQCDIGDAKQDPGFAVTLVQHSDTQNIMWRVLQFFTLTVRRSGNQPDRKRRFLNMGRLLMAMAAVLALAATAQTPNGRAIGVVTSIDAANKQIAIKSDAGPDVHIAILESTSYLRVPPG